MAHPFHTAEPSGAERPPRSSRRQDGQGERGPSSVFGGDRGAMIPAFDRWSASPRRRADLRRLPRSRVVALQVARTAKGKCLIRQGRWSGRSLCGNGNGQPATVAMPDRLQPRGGVRVERIRKPLTVTRPPVAVRAAHVLRPRSTWKLSQDVARCGRDISRLLDPRRSQAARSGSSKERFV